MFNKNEKVVEAVIDEDLEKSYFFPRFIAFIIDILVVALISYGVSYLIPNSKNLEKYETESNEILKDYQDGKITINEYFNKISPVAYDIDYANIPYSLVSIVIMIGYFIIFQFYNKGQTLGKKLMKIRIVSTKDSSLTLNQVAYHALFANTIIFNLLTVAGVLFINKDYYFTYNLVLEGLVFVFMVVAVVMVMFRKDGKGLHDMIASTRVVNDN